MRARCLWTIAVLQMLLLIAWSASAGEIPGPDEVLAQMPARSQGVESGVFLARQELPAEGVVIETEVWFDGVRFRVETRQSWTKPGEAPVTDAIWWAFDGERIVETRPPDMSSAREATPPKLDDVSRYVSLGGMNVLMIWPLARSTVHGRSLPDEVLLHAEGYLETVGQDTIGQDSCIVLSAPRARTPGRFWVCPDRDYALVRYEYDREDGRLVAFEVREWMNVGGSWLPRVAVGYTVERETGEMSPIERCEIISSSFNTPVPEDRFRIPLSDTTVVEPFPGLD